MHLHFLYFDFFNNLRRYSDVKLLEKQEDETEAKQREHFDQLTNIYEVQLKGKVS